MKYGVISLAVSIFTHMKIWNLPQEIMHAGHIYKKLYNIVFCCCCCCCCLATGVNSELRFSAGTTNGLIIFEVFTTLSTMQKSMLGTLVVRIEINEVGQNLKTCSDWTNIDFGAYGILSMVLIECCTGFTGQERLIISNINSSVVKNITLQLSVFYDNDRYICPLYLGTFQVSQNETETVSTPASCTLPSSVAETSEIFNDTSPAAIANAIEVCKGYFGLFVVFCALSIVSVIVNIIFICTFCKESIANFCKKVKNAKFCKNKVQNEQTNEKLELDK